MAEGKKYGGLSGQWRDMRWSLDSYIRQNRAHPESEGET